MFTVYTEETDGVEAKFIHNAEDAMEAWLTATALNPIVEPYVRPKFFAYVESLTRGVYTEADPLTAELPNATVKVFSD